MIGVVLAIFLNLLSLTGDFDETGKINSLKREAEKAYKAGNFELASEKYALLYDSLGINDDAIALNLGHCFYQRKKTDQATKYYQDASKSLNQSIKSKAFNQLGIINFEAQKIKEAEEFFKKSVRNDFSNQEARHNYELAKRMSENQQEQQNNQDQNQEQQNDKENQEENQEQNQEQENKEGNQDQQNQDQQQDQEQQGSEEDKKEQQDGEQEGQEQQGNEEKQEDGQGEQEGSEGEEQGQEEEKPAPGEEESEENGEEEKDGSSQGKGENGNEDQEQPQLTNQPSTSEKLEAMNMSEKKALMILEALKNNEVQYIQQQKRKAQKRPPSNKPDW